MKYRNHLKIIHLISSLSRGGRERQLTTIVANTDLKKYPTKIVYFNEKENTYLNEYNVKEYSSKIKAQSLWGRLLELNLLIKKENPDLVFTWANLESIFILLLNPFHGFKFINGSVRHGIRANKISHYLRTLILHLSPHIVANSYAGLKANKLKGGNVLYNGIDPKFIGKLNEKEKSERRKYLSPFTHDNLLLISVANLVPYKDYFTVLKALQLVKKENYDFHYLILGDGALRSEIEDVINKYDLQDNITLLGNVENVNEYLQMADIFIHSSKGEGCSNAILEAMAAGLPIIASNTGGTSEIVASCNSFLFDYKNVDQIIEKLKYLITDKEKREIFGELSYQRIIENFTINNMMSNYYLILQKVNDH